MKVTLIIDERTWLEFKAECTRRKIKPSHEVEKFMREQAEKWQKGAKRAKDA